MIRKSTKKITHEKHPKLVKIPSQNRKPVCRQWYKYRNEKDTNTNKIPPHLIENNN